MDLELTDEQAHLRSVAGEVLDGIAPLSLARKFLDASGDASALWSRPRRARLVRGRCRGRRRTGVPGLSVLAFELGRHAAHAPGGLDRDLPDPGRRRLRGGRDQVAGNDRRARSPSRSPCSMGPVAGIPAVWRRRPYLGEPGAPERRQARHPARRPCRGPCGPCPSRRRAGPRPLCPGCTRRRGGIRAITGSQLPLVRRHPRRACRPGPQDALVGPVAAEAIERGFLVGAIASAAEALGAASHCLDLAVEYAAAATPVRKGDRLVPGAAAPARRAACPSERPAWSTNSTRPRPWTRTSRRRPRLGGRQGTRLACGARDRRGGAPGVRRCRGAGATSTCCCARPRLWTALWGCTASRGGWARFLRDALGLRR